MKCVHYIRFVSPYAILFYCILLYKYNFKTMKRWFVTSCHRTTGVYNTVPDGWGSSGGGIAIIGSIVQCCVT